MSGQGDGESAGMEARIAAAVAAAVRDQVVAIVDERIGPRRAPSISIRRLFEEFERAHKGDRSWRVCRNRMLPLVRRLGDLPASLLTPMAWAEHRAARASETTRRGEPPKPHTLTIEFFRAKELLKFGVEMGMLESSPLANTKPERTISKRETWLDESGVQKLLGGLDALKGERQRLIMRAFILLCLDGMLRFNEARTLRRDRIRDGVAELSPKSTKNKRERFVGLTPRALQAVAEVPPVLGDPRIFVNPERGDLYAEDTFREWFSIVRFASGVSALAVPGESVVIHTLRHSGASAADARGASAKALQETLGHANLSTTERYLHRHRQAGARALAKLMAEGAERELELERKGPKRAGPPGAMRARRSVTDR